MRKKDKQNLALLAIAAFFLLNRKRVGGGNGYEYSDYIPPRENEFPAGDYAGTYDQPNGLPVGVDRPVGWGDLENVTGIPMVAPWRNPNFPTTAVAGIGRGWQEWEKPVQPPCVTKYAKLVT